MKVYFDLQELVHPKLSLKSLALFNLVLRMRKYIKSFLLTLFDLFFVMALFRGIVFMIGTILITSGTLFLTNFYSTPKES